MATNNAVNEPTAASGTVLQGQGVGTISAYSTATYPSASVGSGKVLYDNGTNFVTSTPTFPTSASATNRKIIVSDGTNWNASTETWAVPGSSGNILTSDGTNWTSASPASAGIVQMVTGTLTNSQIKNLATTPVQILAAPGAGKFYWLLSATGTMVYGGTNAFTSATGNISTYYATATQGVSVLINNSMLATATTTDTTAFTSTSVTSSNIVNAVLNLFNNGAAFAGNAANNNTVDWAVAYSNVAG